MRGAADWADAASNANQEKGESLADKHTPVRL